MNIRWAVSISLLSRKGVLIAAHHYSQPPPTPSHNPSAGHFAIVEWTDGSPAPRYLGRVWPSWRATPFDQIYPARGKKTFFRQKTASTNRYFRNPSVMGGFGVDRTGR